MLYFNTGNACPDFDGAAREGDNLYTDCVVMVDADSGQIRRHYQYTPHDVWDYDSTMESILFEMDGRKCLGHFDKNGYFFVLARTDCSLIRVVPFVDRITWAEIDDNGKVTAKVFPDKEGDPVHFWPGLAGAKEWTHAAYNPNTGLFYAPVQDIGATATRRRREFKESIPYWGAGVVVDGEDIAGSISAFDPNTGQESWQIAGLGTARSKAPSDLASDSRGHPEPGQLPDRDRPGGLKPTLRRSVKTSFIFGLWDGVAPLVGILVGHYLGERIDSTADTIAAVGLGAYGLFVVVRALRTPDDADPDMRWATRGLPLPLSIDNVAAGASLGLIGYSPGLAPLLFGMITFVMSVAGPYVAYVGALVAMAAFVGRGAISYAVKRAHPCADAGSTRMRVLTRQAAALRVCERRGRRPGPRARQSEIELEVDDMSRSDRKVVQ